MLSKMSLLCAVVGSAMADHHMMMTTTGAPEPTENECTHVTTTPGRNTDTDVAYVVAFFGDAMPFELRMEIDGQSRSVLLVPYMINKCTSLAPAQAPMGMFTCDADGNGFTYTQYGPTDTTCTGTMLSSTHYNDSTLLNPAMGFNCGTSDAHMEVIVAAATATCPGSPAYFSLTQCVPARLPPKFVTSSMSQWFCHDNDDYQNNMFTVADGGMCSDAAMCQQVSWKHNTCGPFFTSANSGTTVYAKPKGCVSAGRIPADDDDHASFAALSMFTVLLSALLAVLNA